VPLLGKRALGWLSWKLRRRHAHRSEVLEALIADLRKTAPDHVAVTGDLTNVSLEDEFGAARG
jgi:3',5'-cyclic AMP phosphodiesterase CpdA